MRDGQLQVLWISRVDYLKNSGVNNHTHDFFQMLFVIDGDGIVQNGEQSEVVRPSCCYLFKRNCAHGFYFTRDAITVDIKFAAAEEFSACMEEYGFPEPCQIKNMVPLERLFSISAEMRQAQNDLMPYYVDVEFKSLLLNILREHTIGSVSDAAAPTIDETSKCFTMAQYMSRNLGKDVNLDEMAHLFGFHPHYLIKLFKDDTGMTPMHFLQQLRLEKAKHSLEFTSLSVEEIADIVGMSAPYLSRLFNERFGMPPSKMRESMRTVIGKDIVLEEDFLLDKQPPILPNITGHFSGC